jgi:hypothetical protein
MRGDKLSVSYYLRLIYSDSYYRGSRGWLARGERHAEQHWAAKDRARKRERRTWR